MLIAGGLSFVVGIFYNIQAAGDDPSLDVLSVYATGGGVFFIVQAGLLGWKARQPHTRTARRPYLAVTSRFAPSRRGPGRFSRGVVHSGTEVSVCRQPTR